MYTEVECRDRCSLHVVTSSEIYHSTHARKNVIYLFYTIKIQLVYLRSFGMFEAWKETKIKKSTGVIVI